MSNGLLNVSNSENGPLQQHELLNSWLELRAKHQQIVTRLTALKKCDLHVHLEGSVSLERLKILCQRNQIELTSPTTFRTKVFTPPATLATASSYPAELTWLDFIALYLKISSAITTTADIIEVVEDYARSAAEQSIVYSELYFTPTTFLTLGANLPELYRGLIAGELLARENYGVSISWIFDVVRNTGSDGEETLRQALIARELGAQVKAIGLSGYESLDPFPKLQEFFQRTKSLGFDTIIHAGETSGAESVGFALNELGASRIGHGISSVESSDVLEQLVTKKIPLEISPWSNIKLQVVEPEKHSLTELIGAGVQVVLASDDPGIFERNLVDNYLLAYLMGVSEKELESIALNSLNISGIGFQK